MQLKSLAVLLALVLGAGSARATDIKNGSFETGTFADWITQDAPPDPGTPLRVPLAVKRAGATSPDFVAGTSFSSQPTHGEFAAVHGFDGAGSDGPAIRIAQDILVTADGARIEFDYRAAWDLETYCDACADRVFEVRVEEDGGGVTLLTQTVLTLRALHSEVDTGPRSGSIDLGDFVGRRVRLSFDFAVPDHFSGPAFFQLDQVRAAPSAWIASGAALRSQGGMLRWDSLAGAQPSAASVGSGSARLAPAAQPWFTDAEQSSAALDLRHRLLSFRVQRLSQLGGNRIGTTGGLKTLRATLICDLDGSAGQGSALVDTPRVSLSASGDARFYGSLALPAACLSEPDIALVLRP
jgi:hypothetical protein